MALVTCKECGNQISETAKSCPGCGAAVALKTEAAVDLSAVNFRSVKQPANGGPRHPGTGALAGESGFVAGFERKVLFRIARFVAFTICFVLFLSMVGGLIYIGTSMSGADKPDPAKVVQQLKPAATANTSGSSRTSQPSGSSRPSLGQQSPLLGLRVAPELQELMNQDSNRQVLEGWVAGLDQADRQAFMDGLGEAIREARKHGVDDADAVNTYNQRYQEYLVEREARKLESVESKLYVAGGVISILLLLAVFSLVLVLLAIERNTYRSANAVQQS